MLLSKRFACPPPLLKMLLLWSFISLTSRGQWNVTVIPNPQSLENKVSFNLHLSLLKRSLQKSWRKRKVNLVDIAQAVDKLRVMTWGTKWYSASNHWCFPYCKKGIIGKFIPRVRSFIDNSRMIHLSRLGQAETMEAE